MSGPPIELVASTHVVLPGSAHRIAVQGVAREGAAAEIEVEGVAGELAFLHDTSEPSPRAFPGITGPLFTLAPAQILPLGTLPAGGALSIESVVGTLARWRESLLVFTQGIFLGGPGASFAGEPSAVLLLDASLPAVFPDCDGNGMDDVADIAAGAPDCNANGVPDGCDVALGTSPDCDRNGVPDECDDVREIDALSPSGPQGITLGFGRCDISGDTAIAMPSTNDPAIQAVYVYERDPLLGWPTLETRRLVSSDPQALLTRAIISGDTIVATPLLSIPPAPNDIGPTHVWVRDPRSGWPATETQQLETSDPGDVLQQVLGIDGRTIACYGVHRGVSSSTNAVFVYERNPDGSWPATETAILRFSPLAPGSSAVSEDVIACVDHAQRQVHVFERSLQGTWPASATAVLSSPEPYGDLFGEDIDVDGDTIVVGATSDDALVWRSGSVHVFRRAALGWSIEARLKASTPQQDDLFGLALALQGDALVVCARARDTVKSDTGSAFLFRREGAVWREEVEFAPPTLSSGAIFGGSAALDGSFAVVGARNDWSTPYLGSVTLFELLDADGNGVPDACE